MVIAHHLLWSTYGAWPPNDLRGSSSGFVHHAPLFELANLHHGRKKIQPCNAELREFLHEAAGKLKFPVIPLHHREFQELATVFGEVISENVYTCYACAFMPDHVHLLIRKHKHLAEEMIRNLQVSSRLRFRSAGLRTPTTPSGAAPAGKSSSTRPTKSAEPSTTLRTIRRNFTCQFNDGIS